MEGRGQGYIADMLIFALLVTVACTLLAKAQPVDPHVAEDRYASDLARSALLAFQHSTAGDLGGLRYSLEVPMPWGSPERHLRYKTLAQLLVEDAFCNLRVEVFGRDIALIRPSRGLDERVREFMRSALEDVIGGRFGYRLTVRTVPIDISPAIRVYFEASIESLDGGGGRQLCSETVAMSLPIPWSELSSRIRFCGVAVPELDPNAMAEITLTLWCS